LVKVAIPHSRGGNDPRKRVRGADKPSGTGNREYKNHLTDG
jgi:hypothetical protein